MNSCGKEVERQLFETKEPKFAGMSHLNIRRRKWTYYSVTVVLT